MKPISNAFFRQTLILLIVAVSGMIVFAHSALWTNDPAAQHIDSQVYIHTASSILQGMVLYRDVFDHKGPVMYLLECAGLLLTPEKLWGIWFMQCLLFTIGIFVLIVQWVKKYGWLTAITALIMLSAWLFRTKTIGDNLPESFAPGLVALFLATAFQLMEQQTPTRLQSAVCGLVVISLFLIKANFIILILPCGCWLLVHLQVKKKLIYFLVYALIGASLILIPLLFYFLKQSALRDAIFAIWTINFSYMRQQSLGIMQSIRAVFFSPANYLLIFILLTSLIKICITKLRDARLLIALCSVILSMIVLIGLPGRGAESTHYAMPLAPLLAWLLCETSAAFRPWQKAMLLMTILFFYKPVVIHLFTKHELVKRADQTLTFLRQHRKTGETLSVWGNRSSLYQQSGMNCNTGWFYTYPLMQECESSLNQNFSKAFNRHPADWIVYQQRAGQTFCFDSLLADYTLVADFETERIYQLKKTTE